MNKHQMSKLYLDGFVGAHDFQPTPHAAAAQSRRDRTTCVWCPHLAMLH